MSLHLLCYYLLIVLVLQFDGASASLLTSCPSSAASKTSKTSKASLVIISAPRRLFLSAPTKSISSPSPSSSTLHTHLLRISKWNHTPSTHRGVIPAFAPIAPVATLKDQSHRWTNHDRSTSSSMAGSGRIRRESSLMFMERESTISLQPRHERHGRHGRHGRHPPRVGPLYASPKTNAENNDMEMNEDESEDESEEELESKTSKETTNKKERDNSKANKSNSNADKTNDPNNTNKTKNTKNTNNPNNPNNSSTSDTPNKKNNTNKPSLLQIINPYNAGKSLRSQFESAIDLASAIASSGSSKSTSSPLSSLSSLSSVSPVSPDRKKMYDIYLEDRLGLTDLGGVGGMGAMDRMGGVGGMGQLGGVAGVNGQSLQPYKYDKLSKFDKYDNHDNRPEVLIVGATGSLGQVLVKRLLVENRVRIRVLVRDLYSSTLNKLGTGVTYCQGDLENRESLEYAVTDVDKIVFCAGGRWEEEVEEDDDGGGTNVAKVANGNTRDPLEQMERILQKRSKQAELVDSTGLRNLIHAYLNVRHADYGTSQAAKRVLFKFRKRKEDFDLFSVDDGTVDVNDEDDADKYEEGDSTAKPIASTKPNFSTHQWKRNKFNNAIFHGKVRPFPSESGEATLVSARLRSRSDPTQGIDLRTGGFAGLVCRICSDGGVYEAFVRTECYERLGVEYVCEFRTASKSVGRGGGGANESRDKFSTVRLEFSDFRPRLRRFPKKKRPNDNGTHQEHGNDDLNSDPPSDKDDIADFTRARQPMIIPPFTGRDIRQIGFRFRGENNLQNLQNSRNSYTSNNSFHSYNSNGVNSNKYYNSGWIKFYLAIDYIKVYRSQPEPEFVYLSDARIPPVVTDGMVREDIRQLVASSSSSSSSSLLEEESAKKVRDKREFRSKEETYYKYKGEEIIKQSGLSYTIIRVAGYNELPSTDSSAVRLQKTNENMTPVSRADLAQVIGSALLAPAACNLVLYMTKATTRGVVDGDIWTKFARLKSEKEKMGQGAQGPDPQQQQQQPFQ